MVMSVTRFQLFTLDKLKKMKKKLHKLISDFDPNPNSFSISSISLIKEIRTNFSCHFLFSRPYKLVEQLLEETLQFITSCQFNPNNKKGDNFLGKKWISDLKSISCNYHDHRSKEIPF